MIIHKSINNLNIKKPVVTIGMFDGVHNGHKMIFSSLKDYAKKINGESIVLSFWPHPRMIFEGNASVRLLTTMDEKLNLLEKEEIDHFVLIPFNREFANISYKSFVKEILYKKLKINTIIIGFDHQFGKNREGDFNKLTELSKVYRFNVQKLDAQIIENEKVSSSIIRNSLNEGNIEMANKYLGYIYNFSGYVVEGKKNGRAIGYPTANLFIKEPYKLIPGSGVYAVTAIMEDKNFKGMMNIGYRPTIVEDNKQKSIEVHLFDINKDLYGKNITINVLKKVRNEEKFSSVETLKSQIKEDEVYIRKFLSEH